MIMSKVNKASILCCSQHLLTFFHAHKHTRDLTLPLYPTPLHHHHSPVSITGASHGAANTVPRANIYLVLLGASSIIAFERRTGAFVFVSGIQSCPVGWLYMVMRNMITMIGHWGISSPSSSSSRRRSGKVPERVLD
jgi:hypothetical protein